MDVGKTNIVSLVAAVIYVKFHESIGYLNYSGANYKQASALPSLQRAATRKMCLIKDRSMYLVPILQVGILDSLAPLSLNCKKEL
jgi:hypothetical protein